MKEGETPISASMAEESINALLVECGKQEPVYKKHAIAALGKALAALHTDRFQQVYDIVKVILLKVCLHFYNAFKNKYICASSSLSQYCFYVIKISFFLHVKMLMAVASRKKMRENVAFWIA